MSDLLCHCGLVHASGEELRTRTISKGLLDELLKGSERPGDLLGDAGLMNERKNRGVQDVLIAVVDGLKGFPEAITAAFPDATVQTCIVDLVGHSLNVCAGKDRKAVASDLRLICGAPTADQAAAGQDAFAGKWAGK